MRHHILELRATLAEHGSDDMGLGAYFSKQNSLLRPNRFGLSLHIIMSSEIAIRISKSMRPKSQILMAININSVKTT